MRKMASYFFPTTALIVDDNCLFLQDLASILPTDNLSYQFFDVPEHALKFANNSGQSGHIDSCIKKNDVPDSKLLKLDVGSMYQEICNQKRFEQISCVVVDYDMPGMNGLEFCEQIKDPHIQKILLTGMIEEKEAIRAFNNGIIQKYIRKQDINIVKSICDAVVEAGKRYFLSKSKVVDSILQDSSNNSAMNDPVFRNYFLRKFKEVGGVEYYPYQTDDCFIMLDTAGKSFCLNADPKNEFQPNTERVEGKQTYFCSLNARELSNDLGEVASFATFKANLKETLPVAPHY